MPGYGPGPGMEMGRWIRGMDKEEFDKFLDDTRDLRKELHMKMFEYRELLRDENAGQDKIERLEDEIISLKRKIHRKMRK